MGQPLRQDVVMGRAILFHGQVFVGIDDVECVDEICEFFADGGFSDIERSPLFRAFSRLGSRSVKK
ncbi:hypothetical protein HN588_17885 [Candidatus Bathyarchaeota archaeon]|nr:hypothetical protein [Candidatus Bathyarchaeota archaeon]